MFSSLARLLETTLSSHDASPPQQREDAIRVATAALLIEVARADFDSSSVELGAARRLLSEQFSLSAEEAQDLVAAAETASDQSASLYRFTHAVHEHLTPAEKRRVIEMLWRVALADATLDKYEDSLMHKIAELIYVPHGELMQVKNQVLEEVRAER